MKPRKAHDCKDCDYCHLLDEGIECENGHKPRFYMDYQDWAYQSGTWKRRCEDFEPK